MNVNQAEVGKPKNERDFPVETHIKNSTCCVYNRPMWWPKTFVCDSFQDFQDEPP